MVHLQYELNSTKFTQAMVHLQYELNSTKVTQAMVFTLFTI